MSIYQKRQDKMETTTSSIIESTNGIEILEFCAMKEITPDLVLRRDGELYSLPELMENKRELVNVVTKQLYSPVSDTSDENLIDNIVFSFVYSKVGTDIQDETNIEKYFREIRDAVKLNNVVGKYFQVYVERVLYMQKNVEKIKDYLTHTTQVLCNMARGHWKEWNERIKMIKESGETKIYEDEISEWNERKRNLPRGEFPYNEYLPYSTSDYSFTSITYTAVLQDFKQGVVDGFKLFNEATPTENNPFILYTINDEQKYYKIYPGFETCDINSLLIRPFESAKDVIIRKPIIRQIARRRGKRAVEEKILSEYKDRNTLQYITRYLHRGISTYINIILYLETKTAEIYINGKDLLERANIMSDVLPPLEELVPSEIAGSFKIFGEHIPPYVLQEIIQNTPGMNNFLTMHERIKINISDLQGYIFQFPQYSVCGDFDISMREFATPIRFYIENGFVTRESYDELGNVIEIGSRMVTISFSNANSMEELERFKVFMRLFAAYAGNRQYEISDEYFNVIGEDYPDYTKTRNLYNKTILQFLKPNVFKETYSKSCAAKYQPYYIETREDAVGSGEIIEFPFGDHKPILLQCPEETPYFTMKINPEHSDMSSIYIPCCSKTDSKYRRERIENYINKGVFETETQLYSDASIIFRTMRLLDEGQEGIVDKTNLISLYSYIGLENGIPVRIGMANDTNSFIQSVSFLMDSEITTRKQILEMTNWFPDVAAQEILEYQKILENFEDENINIDISYFRILEEVYKCNIFVLHYSDGNIEFKDPPYRGVYYRNIHRDRPGIFVFEHNNHLVTYEPIVYRTSDGRNVKTFSYEMCKTVLRLYNKSKGVILNDSDYCVLNIEDFPTNGTLVGQKVDHEGKCRGLIFSDATYIFNPCPPFNIEINDLFYPITDLSLLKDFKLSSYSCHSAAQGVWIKIRDHEVFAYTEDNIDLPRRKIPKSERGVPEILHTDTFNPRNFIFSYPLQKDNLERIMDFMYLSLHVLLSWDRKEWPEDWYNEIFVIRKVNYDTSRVPSEIPINVTLKDILSYETNVVIKSKSKRFPYKIAVIDEKFGEDMRFFMRNMVKQNIDPTFQMKQSLTRANFERETLLHGDLEYSVWIDARRFHTRSYNKILYRYNSIYPYIYQPMEKVYFIIQLISPELGKEGASFVSYMWNLYRINYGYNPNIKEFTSNMSNDLVIEDGRETQIVDEQIEDLTADYFTSADGSIFAILPLTEDFTKQIAVTVTTKEGFTGQDDAIEKEIVIENALKARRRRRDLSIVHGGAVRRGRRGRGRPRKGVAKN